MNKKFLLCMLLSVIICQEKIYSMTLSDGDVCDGNGLMWGESITVSGNANIGDGDATNNGGALVYDGDGNNDNSKMEVQAKKTLSIKSDGQFLNEQGQVSILGTISNEGLFVNQGTITIENGGTLSCGTFGTAEGTKTIGGILNLSSGTQKYVVNITNKNIEKSNVTENKMSGDATIVCDPGSTISGTGATIDGGIIDISKYVEVN